MFNVFYIQNFSFQFQEKSRSGSTTGAMIVQTYSNIHTQVELIFTHIDGSLAVKLFKFPFSGLKIKEKNCLQNKMGIYK